MQSKDERWWIHIKDGKGKGEKRRKQGTTTSEGERECSSIEKGEWEKKETKQQWLGEAETNRTTKRRRMSHIEEEELQYTGR